MAKHREKCVRHLLSLYQETGSTEVRDQIVESHLPLVRRLCRRFAHTPEPQEDLVQVGCIGLLKAIKKFDLTRGTNFISFAIPEILGEILNYFRDHGWTVKVPRKLQAHKVLVSRTSYSLAQQWGRWPTVPEIAASAGLTDHQVIDAMLVERNGVPLSLDGELGNDDGEAGGPLVDALGEEDPAFELSTNRLLLEDILRILDQRERTIVYLRFYRDQSQTAIAHRLGISQMHVSRLLRRAIAKMREALAPVPTPSSYR